MSKGKIILIHLLAWLSTSIIFSLASENIIAWLLPGLHDVMMWLNLLIGGLSIIFIVSVLSLTLFLKKIRS